MPALRWTDEAIDDVTEIVAYIEERNPDAAERLYADIVATAEQFSERPFLYRPGRVPGTSEVVVRPNYLIAYEAGETTVDALRVLHTARRYP